MRFYHAELVRRSDVSLEGCECDGSLVDRPHLNRLAPPIDDYRLCVPVSDQVYDNVVRPTGNLARPAPVCPGIAGAVELPFDVIRSQIRSLNLSVNRRRAGALSASRNTRTSITILETELGELQPTLFWCLSARCKPWLRCMAVSDLVAARRMIGALDPVGDIQ